MHFKLRCIFQGGNNKMIRIFAALTDWVWTIHCCRAASCSAAVEPLSDLCSSLASLQQALDIQDPCRNKSIIRNKLTLPQRVHLLDFAGLLEKDMLLLCNAAIWPVCTLLVVVTWWWSGGSVSGFVRHTSTSTSTSLMMASSVLITFLSDGEWGEGRGHCWQPRPSTQHPLSL